MRIDIVTLFPQMFNAITEFGVVGRAVQQEILSLTYWNPRDYADNKHNRVDDRPYGGGPGMLMQYAPMRKTLAAAKQKNIDAPVIYLSPQGRKLDQAGLEELAENKGLILLNGRYEGIDERIIETDVDQEWSLGDYVISGGELASMVMIDGIARLLPNVLGHEESAEQDSYSNGLLDCPHYTRPESIDGLSVPNVLMSGDHKAIENWRLKQSLGRTAERRPDLLKKLNLSEKEQQLLDEYIQESKKV